MPRRFLIRRRNARINSAGLGLRTLTTLAGIAKWQSRFRAIIAHPSRESAATIDYLDEDDSGRVDETDMEAHLDALLRANGLTLTDGRHTMSGVDATPSNFNESDPFGLAVGRDNSVVIIDHANTGGVYVGANVAGDRNKVYTNAARDSLATPNFLFGSSDSNTVSTYNHGAKGSTGANVFKEIRDLYEYSSSTARRMPHDGSPVTWYIRGGEYQWGFASSLRIQKNVAGATHNSRIIIRAYPGEDVTIKNPSFDAGSGDYSTAVRWIIGRPDVRIERITLSGKGDYDGIGQVFCGTSGILQTDYAEGVATQQGTRFQLVRCTIRDTKAIPDDHAQAGSFGKYIDKKFKAADRVGGANNDSINGITLNGPNALIRNNHFQMAEDDFPDLSTDYGGEPLTVNSGASGTIIKGNLLNGSAPHSQLQLVNASNVIVERNDISNSDQLCVLYTGAKPATNSGCAIRYNRIHDWSKAVGNQSGGGLQLSGIQEAIIEGNVLWSNDVTAARDGLRLNTDPHNATGDPSPDADADLHSNIVRGNVIYGASLTIEYSNADPTDNGELADKIYNNTVTQNIVIGPSIPQSLDSDVDAPVFIEFGSPDEDMRGNLVTDNLLGRAPGTGSSDDVLIQYIWDPQGPIPLEAADIATAIPEFTGNTRNDDPGFNDPDNGDFTGVTGLPFSLSAATPLAAFAVGPDA